MVGSLYSHVTLSAEQCYQLLKRSCLVQFRIVPMVEHFKENPLCPFVIPGIAGTYFPVPIIGKAQFIQLFSVSENILFCGGLRRLTCLDGVLFCRKTKGIVSHGMQYIVAF